MKKNLKQRKDSILGVLMVLGIAMSLAGIIGFLIMTNIIVVAPIVLGMASADRKSIKGRWNEASKGQKITIGTVVLLMLPIIVVGILWLFVGASDYLIDALIVVPLVYIAIWFFWGRKQKVANYKEDGGMFEGGAGSIAKKMFSNQLVAIICLLMVVGILIFAGINFNTETTQKSASKDMANTKSGIQNPIVPAMPSTATAYTNISKSAGGNATMPLNTPVPPIENSYDMMNITVFAYDPYIASYKYIQGGTYGNAYHITNYAENYTYVEDTSTLVYGAQGVKMLSMPNTKITLLGGTGSKIASNTTDEDGKCHFNNVLIGQYVVEWGRAGYATTKANIDLGELVGEDATPTEIIDEVEKDGKDYINHYFYYAPTKEVYAPLKPSGMEVEITFVVSSDTTIENVSIPAKEYYAEEVETGYEDVPILGGVLGWVDDTLDLSGYGYELSKTMGQADTEPVLIGTKNITEVEVYLIPRLFSTIEMTTIRNLERQQSMWGWSGLPEQVGLQNSILSNKQNMQSMFNSMWGGLQSVMPYLQTMGATYTGETAEGNALTYHSHSIKVLSSYITSTNYLGELNTYVPIVLQKNTMNTISGSQDPANFDARTNGGKSILIARPYRFFVITPQGGDLTIDFEVSVSFVNTTFDISYDSLFNPSVWGSRNETYTFTQSLTWSSAYDPMGAYAYTGTTPSDANEGVLTTPPEDGVETPEEGGITDLFPSGASP